MISNSQTPKHVAVYKAITWGTMVKIIESRMFVATAQEGKLKHPNISLELKGAATGRNAFILKLYVLPINIEKATTEGFCLSSRLQVPIKDIFLSTQPAGSVSHSFKELTKFTDVQIADIVTMGIPGANGATNYKLLSQEDQLHVSDIFLLKRGIRSVNMF